MEAVSHPVKQEDLPTVAQMFSRPVQPKTDGDIDTRSRLLDKTMDGMNLDQKFDLSSADGKDDNRLLFMFSIANAYAIKIKERYGSVVLTDYFEIYKKQSMSKGRASRQEMVEIIAGRNFPEFDDVMNQANTSSLVDKVRSVIRR